ncbi:EboA domain-containing protein [Streptomyces sp. NPDC004111]|uniref:EboA domain-containing protein n=1 Tax=Streptomyces sp. NPDC004111 TaxID=3364690 RepID=UPI0036776469
MTTPRPDGPVPTGTTRLRDTLEAELPTTLTDEGRTWLTEALATARAHTPATTSDGTGTPATASHATTTPAAASDGTHPPGPAPRPTPPWELRFAEAGRHCRPRTADSPGPAPADVARVLLLRAAGADLATVRRLYATGSAAERRAVLLALGHLDQLRDGSAVDLVEDALRANDTRLVAAAVGPYAAAHLPAHAWRHAVLKCLFTGVPVSAVAALTDRARGDTELARMLTDYAAERTAAGRPVPADLHRVRTLTAPAEES